jgi:dienelactone hydrolase
MSLAGLIAWEDLRCAEVLANQPEVDAGRIAAVGWSMGAFRTWQAAALSPHISAGIAVCWMNTVNHLRVPGNNQTEGHSAYTMLHPGLLGELDYPDIASLACPKSMLFFAGRRDHLFPEAGSRSAFETMTEVWSSQGASESLTTEFWDTGHVFNATMQDDAFSWLDDKLKQ